VSLPTMCQCYSENLNEVLIHLTFLGTVHVTLDHIKPACYPFKSLVFGTWAKEMERTEFHGLSSLCTPLT
jgi:hypothetical protein